MFCRLFYIKKKIECRCLNFYRLSDVKLRLEVLRIGIKIERIVFGMPKIWEQKSTKKADHTLEMS